MPTPRIAFLIEAHSDAPLLQRLCRRLKDHALFVHVDQRAANFPVDQIASLPGVHLVAPRTPVYWGDFSQVEAILTLMRSARAAGPFDHYVLISGACYPVKPIRDLEAAFALDPTREWIALTPIAPRSHLHNLIGRRWRMKPFVSNPRIDIPIRRVWNKISGFIGRNLQQEISAAPHFGSSWWGLTDPCVDYILQFVATNPSYVRAYESVYGVDEHIFHTIVANSPFAPFACQVEDSESGTNQAAPLHLIGVTQDRSFGSDDAAFALAASTDKFFIRKVSSTRSAKLLDRIDRELLHVDPADGENATGTTTDAVPSSGSPHARTSDTIQA